LEKSRLLTFDPGDRSDAKYYGWSTSVNRGSALYNSYLKDTAVHYYDGRSKADTSTYHTASSQGSENFQSTTQAKPQFNACNHIKYSCFNQAYAVLHAFPAGSGVCYFEPYWRKSSNMGLVNIVPVSSAYTWADCDAIQRRAWWSMQPRFESEVSMLNFIIELKDFKHLFKSIISFNWAKAARLLQNAAYHLRQMAGLSFKVRAAGTLGDTTSSVAKLWLFHQFALKPLISDIKEILGNIVQTAEAAQAKFLAQGDEYNRSHYSETLEEVLTGSYGSNSSAYVYSGSRKLAKFTATLEYSYNYEARTGWDLFTRYWGLDVNASVIWEAIPFSFLIDYFYQVGKAIRNMALDPNVKTHIYQYCESFDVSSFSGIGFNASSPLIEKLFMVRKGREDGALLGFIPIAGYLGNYYRRRLTFPNKGSALPRARSASTTQKWNMAALVRGFFK